MHIFALVVPFLLQAAAWHPPIPDRVLYPAHSKGASARYRRVVRSWLSAPLSDSSHVYSPLDFGGDPSGVIDSTLAVQEALAAVLNASSTIHDASGIKDCGGATLDLQGGEYLVSEPIVIPALYGNFRLTQGTLRASPSFPTSGYLLDVGGSRAGDTNNIDVLFDALFLDAFQVAAGGLQATGLFGGVIGPQVYVFNFTETGIMVTSGHELTIQQTWVGEFWWSDSRKENANASIANGIVIDGNDHVVADVIVFSSKVGIAVSGGADLVSNVHTWNLATANGGIGILVNSSQTRVQGE
jgi:hypothetical protein